ncbi:MAG: glycosyltransferase family 4 protein [Pseudonocardia sp.]
MTRKRLLYVTPALPPTRVPEADHGLYQCLHMAEAGLEVHVLTKSGQGIDTHPSITVHDVVHDWSWRELRTLVALVRRVRPHALMISFLGSLYGYRALPTALPLVLRLLRPRATCLVQFANLGQGLGLRGIVRPFLFRTLGRFRYGSLLVTPDVLVALSEEHRARIGTLAPSMAGRTHVVPVSSQVEPVADAAAARARGRARLDLADDDVLVTFFGRLYPDKGIEQLVEAVATVRLSRPQVRLVLVGGFLDTSPLFGSRGSYQRELAATIERLGATDLIRFSGEFSWDGAEASEYLFASDIAVLPLGPGIHLYNSSLAAICAHGVPVIGTRGERVDPPLRHRDTVYFIDDGAPDTIAAALHAVLDDPALRETLAAGSRRLGREQFDGKVSTHRLIELMRLDDLPACAPTHDHQR